MPELPEVETVRRGVAPALEGARIERAWAFRPDLRWPLPERFAERLAGRRAERVRRRSKYLLVDLAADGRAPAEVWLVHLGMSGRIAVRPFDAGAPVGRLGRFHHAVAGPDHGAVADRRNDAPPEGLGPHDHVAVETERALLVYTDPRRFGAMDLFARGEERAHKLLAALGPEPFDEGFDARLAAGFAGKLASVKAALLDQKLVAGLGNIYVCEALWRARVDPRRAAGALSAARVAILAESIRAVLTEAIAAGGSTLRDHVGADGPLGYFQHAFAVYGRAGEPCLRPRCRGVVARVAQTGRSTFFCPRCQR